MKLKRKQLKSLIETLLLEKEDSESKLSKAKERYAEFQKGGGIKGARERNIEKRLDKERTAAREKSFGDIDRKLEKEKEQQDFDAAIKDLQEKFNDLDSSYQNYWPDSKKIMQDLVRQYIKVKSEHKYNVNKKEIKAIEAALIVGFQSLKYEIQGDDTKVEVEKGELEYFTRLSMVDAEQRISYMKVLLKKLKEIVAREDDLELELKNSPEAWTKKIEEIDLTPLKVNRTESAAEKPISTRVQQFDLKKNVQQQIDKRVAELETAANKFIDDIQTNRIFVDNKPMDENIYRLAEAPVNLKNRCKLISLLIENEGTDVIDSNQKKSIELGKIKDQLKQLNNVTDPTLNKADRKDVRPDSKRKAELAFKKIKESADKGYDTLAKLLQRYTEIKIPGKMLTAIGGIYHTVLGAIISEAWVLTQNPKYDDNSIERAQIYYYMIFDLVEELDRFTTNSDILLKQERIRLKEDDLEMIYLKPSVKLVKELEAKYIDEKVIKQGKKANTATEKKRKAEYQRREKLKADFKASMTKTIQGERYKVTPYTEERNSNFVNILNIPLDKVKVSQNDPKVFVFNPVTYSNLSDFLENQAALRTVRRKLANEDPEMLKLFAINDPRFLLVDLGYVDLYLQADKGKLHIDGIGVSNHVIDGFVQKADRIVYVGDEIEK